MPDLILLEEDSSVMTERPIDLGMLARVDSDQKATASRVDNIDQSLHRLEREVSEINGALKSAETSAWVKHYVYPCCVLISAGMVGIVITLMVEMHGVRVFLSDNAGFVAALRLEHNSANPKDAHNIADTQQVLKSARANKISIAPDVVAKTGTKFLEASQSDAAAWDTALAFIDYRSYLNGPRPALSDYYPVGMKSNPDHLEMFNIFLQHPLGTQPPAFTTSYARAGIEVSARIDQIGKPLPQTAKKGADSLLGIGGALELGGLYLRHVVLYDVEIHYSGGPLILDDVTFINCHFVISATPDTRTLVNRILADRSVQFTA